MKIAEIKVELSKGLLELEDKKVLSQIETILNDALATQWNEVPTKLKTDISESTAQLDSGKFVINQEVFSQVNEKIRKRKSLQLNQVLGL